MLYCLPTVHGPTCTYSWRKIGGLLESSYPSSPCLFVDCAGMYQCIVCIDSTEFQSDVIHVSVDVGEFVVVTLKAGQAREVWRSGRYSNPPPPPPPPPLRMGCVIYIVSRI